ncbi:MAG: hypothetical protein Fur0014_13830 [Rubrivivax sp.]
MPDTRPLHPALAAAPPQPSAQPAAAARATATAAAPRRWRSAELFGPALEIEIEHGQAVYRLRMTALGKLILTK